MILEIVGVGTKIGKNIHAMKTISSASQCSTMAFKILYLKKIPYISIRYRFFKNWMFTFSVEFFSFQSYKEFFLTNFLENEFNCFLKT